MNVPSSFQLNDKNKCTKSIVTVFDKLTSDQDNKQNSQNQAEAGEAEAEADFEADAAAAVEAEAAEAAEGTYTWLSPL